MPVIVTTTDHSRSSLQVGEKHLISRSSDALTDQRELAESGYLSRWALDPLARGKNVKPNPYF